VPWLLRRLNHRYRDATATALAEVGFEGLPKRGYWALMALAVGARDASELVSGFTGTLAQVARGDEGRDAAAEK